GSQETRGTGRKNFVGVRTERAQARGPPHERSIHLRGAVWRREMIALKVMRMIAGVSLMAAALVFPLYGLWMHIRYAQMKKSRGDGMLLEGAPKPEPAPIAWGAPFAMALVACLPLLIATSMVVVPSGMG